MSQLGSQVTVNLSKQQILDQTPQGQYSNYADLVEEYSYPSSLDYLQEDAHGYSIIDPYNIDNIDDYVV